MVISREKVQEMYQSGAKHYDFTIFLFRLIGFRMEAYRLFAVKKLSLQRGDFVIELGCGTGLNFPFLMQQIGPEGRLIGVDLTPGMLDIARERVKRSGWKNVELIQSDIAAYDFPKGVNGVLAVGVFGYIPEYDRVIKAASQALVTGGHILIVDGKQPKNLPAWLFKIVLRLGKPFGVAPDYFNSRAQESVEFYFKETSFETRYGGMLYFVSGTV